MAKDDDFNQYNDDQLRRLWGEMKFLAKKEYKTVGEAIEGVKKIDRFFDPASDTSLPTLLKALEEEVKKETGPAAKALLATVDEKARKPLLGCHDKLKAMAVILQSAQEAVDESGLVQRNVRPQQRAKRIRYEQFARDIKTQLVKNVEEAITQMQVDTNNVMRGIDKKMQPYMEERLDSASDEGLEAAFLGLREHLLQQGPEGALEEWARIRQDDAYVQLKREFAKAALAFQRDGLLIHSYAADLGKKLGERTR